LLQPSGWSHYVHWKRCTNVVLAEPDRREWTYVERAPLTRAARITLAQPVYEEFHRLDEVAIARNGRDIPAKHRSITCFELTPCADGTRIGMETRAAGRISLGRLWVAKKAQERQLYALRSYVRSQKPEPGQSIRFDVRGWGWLGVLLAPFAANALFHCGVVGPAVLAGAFVGAILLREIGHMMASLAFGRRRIVVALSPLTGAATMRAREFRSKVETAVVSLSGPAFAAATALTLTPAIDRVGNGFAAVMTGGKPGFFADTLDLACAALALFTLALNLVALIPFRSSLGAVLIQAVARGTLERITLAAATSAAIVCVFPGATPEVWATLVAGLLPPVLLWLVLWNVSGDSDGFAHLPRQQATKVLASIAMVLAVYGIVKIPLGTAADMSRAAAQSVQQDESVPGARPVDLDI